MEKKNFVLTCRRFDLGECFTPEGEELEGEETARVLEELSRKHPEIFLHPKDESVVEIVDCIMSNKSCEHIVDARVLKGGLVIPDDDAQPISMEEGGLLLVTGTYAYVELTLDCGFDELDEDSRDDIYADIRFGIILNLKCEGYCWVSTGWTDMDVNLADADELAEIRKLL